jgi:hypothetical protein
MRAKRGSMAGLRVFRNDIRRWGVTHCGTAFAVEVRIGGAAAKAAAADRLKMSAAATPRVLHAAALPGARTQGVDM